MADAGVRGRAGPLRRARHRPGAERVGGSRELPPVGFELRAVDDEEEDQHAEQVEVSDEHERREGQRHAATSAAATFGRAAIAERLCRLTPCTPLRSAMATTCGQYLGWREPRVFMALMVPIGIPSSPAISVGVPSEAMTSENVCMAVNLQKADHKVKGPISDLQIHFLHNADMERNDRLKAARERHFRTAKEAAMSLGVPYGTYSGHEKGSRGIKDDELALYARRFRVPLEWLSFGIGSMESSAAPAFMVSVMGKIGAGATILPELEQVPTAGLYEIETTFAVPEGAIAFEIEGDSMWPRYDPGDIIVCWREGSNLDEVIGWEAAVRTRDGMRYLKRILRGSEPETFDLESHNAPPIRGVRLEWVAKVHAVVRADMWRRATPAQQVRITRNVKKAAG